ncbi:hypothetical protein SAMN00120144_4077 [Hymenobacter roseosalivarius DSM 11622]|uniref:Uncharacterized protein n=1 Tax=Hymenobacter roseosalivarius DSM 11622 TaxID=645990 RepID=A0A1W1W4V6_9BACT|nr:hypothetical protein [Hymenobacter roseosalivarius]SMC00635.1 hypothetical protein SAMN00120144_4077 [Hymenobacter roseosalivarius DSM 11622]
MSTPPKRNFTAKTARPTIDTSALYGMEEVPAAPAAQQEPIASQAAPTVPAEDAGQEWVQFSTYLRRNTYLRLKQAEYWEPGFIVRQQIEGVVSDLLDKLESANRSLPEDQLQKLLQKNRKLRP